MKKILLSVSVLSLVSCGRSEIDVRHPVINPMPSPAPVQVSCTETRGTFDGKTGTEIACGDKTTIIYDGINGASCTETPVIGGVDITCGNEVTFIANGKDSTVAGPAGSSGPAGAQGVGAGILTVPSRMCPSGGVDITTFIDVHDTGVFTAGDVITSLSTICNGVDGSNGVSSTISQSLATSAQCPTGGVVYTTNQTGSTGEIIENSTKQGIVCNGAVGKTGDQGAQGSQGVKGDQGSVGQTGSAGKDGVTTTVTITKPIQTITPCGPASSPWKERLLCVGNNLLSSFSDNASGTNTRLAFLTEGSFIDTDSSGCTFSVIVTDSSTSVSWSAGSNQYAAWAAQSVTCSDGSVK